MGWIRAIPRSWRTPLKIDPGSTPPAPGHGSASGSPVPILKSGLASRPNAENQSAQPPACARGLREAFADSGLVGQGWTQIRKWVEVALRGSARPEWADIPRLRYSRRRRLEISHGDNSPLSNARSVA